MDPTKSSPAHPSEEILEEYVFHRLPEALAAPIEEHLLICRSCQDTVANTDRFVADLKLAAKQPIPAIGQTRWGWGLAPVLALALLTLMVVGKYAPAPLSAPVAVRLSSLRGLNPLAEAPAGKPLRFTFEAPDLSSQEYRVEVVDSAGAPVWKGAFTETDGKLVATMLTPLSNGVYWVRLYGVDSELLREFGLSAK